MSTAIANRNNEVVATIGRMAPEFEKALANTGIPIAKFVRVAQTAVQMEPKLLADDVNRISLYAALVRCAQDGLLPDKREAALVPFKGQIQYMPMIGGILKKVRNSGEIVDIGARIVREGEPFRRWTDEAGEHLLHEQDPFGTAAKAVGVYAYARTKDGGFYVETMSIAEVEKVRAVSRSKDDGPWTVWWDEKAKVACLRRLSKRLPMSTDVEDFMREAIDADTDFDQAAAPASEAKGPAPSRPTRLAAVAAQAPQAPASAADEDDGDHDHDDTVI